MKNTDDNDDKISLESSDEDQISWCLVRSIFPHKFVGDIDDDCKKCGYSIYLAIHIDAFPRLP